MCTWNPAGSYDLVMGNTICKVCYNADGIGHTDNCPGLGAVTGDHTFAMYYRTSTIPSGLDVDIYNTRLRQHEISHNYGCEDGGCMYNSPCIMKGSYDTVDVYDSLQLWCADCHFDFNPNIQ
jgi:predicted Zn-dependent protease